MMDDMETKGREIPPAAGTQITNCLGSSLLTMQPLSGLLGAHGAAVYQLTQTSPLHLQTSADRAVECSEYFSRRPNSSCDWQQGHRDLTIRQSGTGICCRGLQSPGHPLTRHSHLALLIPSIPLHDSGDPVHITRLSSDQSPGRTSITYNTITVISVPSSPAGRQTSVQRSRF